MSWFRDDPFEYFTPSYPLSSPLHSHLLSSPPIPPLPPSSCAQPPSFGAINISYRDIPTLERDFCSDFACCGLRLADLHELVEHFEKSHAPFFGPPDGGVDRTGSTCASSYLYAHKRIDTPDASRTLNPRQISNIHFLSSPVPPPLGPPPLSSSSSSSSCSSPSPSPLSSSLSLSPAFSPVSIPTPAHTPITAPSPGYVTPYLSDGAAYDCGAPAQAQAHVDSLQFNPEEPHASDDGVGKVEGDAVAEYVFDTANASQRSHSPPRLTCLPPSSFSVPLPPHPGNGNAGKAHSRAMRAKTTTSTPLLSVDTDVKSRGTRGNGQPSPEPYPTSRSPLHSRPQSEEASHVGGDNTHSGSKPGPIRVRRHGHGQSHGRPGKRERMFKCPRSGCTKAYLNPNGLKYHVEKGTCTMEME